jgi:hypothetical protein
VNSILCAATEHPFVPGSVAEDHTSLLGFHMLGRSKLGHILTTTEVEERVVRHAAGCHP